MCIVSSSLQAQCTRKQVKQDSFQSPSNRSINRTATSVISGAERGTRSQCQHRNLSRVFSFLHSPCFLRIQDLKTSFTSLYEITMATEEHGRPVANNAPELVELRSPVNALPNAIAGYRTADRAFERSRIMLLPYYAPFTSKKERGRTALRPVTFRDPRVRSSIQHWTGTRWHLCTANRNSQKGGSIRIQPCMQQPNARRRIATSAMYFEPIIHINGCKTDPRPDPDARKMSTQPAGIALFDVICLDDLPPEGQQCAKIMRGYDLMLDWSHSMSACTGSRIRDEMFDAKHATTSQNRALSGALGHQKNLFKYGPHCKRCTRDRKVHARVEYVPASRCAFDGLMRNPLGFFDGPEPGLMQTTSRSSNAGVAVPIT
ncbi:uncharacterized protein MYCFIDRAFT_207480, partial [Pseudocercospora fijiensis CIRAD86]